MKSEVMKRKNLWQTYSEAQLEKLEKTNALYRTCLDEGKTERECVQKTIELARAQGYEDMKQERRFAPEIKYIWIIWGKPLYFFMQELRRLKRG